ncbi:ATPase [Macleaya cordata]|uniref:ATPase n=1 Tax=Macleaya cordata TaxID=56857 RepID=A0A200PXH8_MACCD|nr:ATPase [Macleaya cordata]
MTEVEDASNHSGLIVANNEIIRSFLSSAKTDPNLTDELHQIASNLFSQTSIPYKSLRNLWSESLPSTRPNLLHLFSGSNFVLSSPKPREKSKELQERLKKLSDLAERKEYKELVKDITPVETTNEPFSSYKDQLGFGLHVGLTMFTGYLVGYATFRALFNHNPVMNAAGGILGLVFAMLLETLLFIIRTSNQGPVSSSSTSKLKKSQ